MNLRFLHRPFEDSVRAAQNHRQIIVEIVRDSARQLTHSAHFLRATQLIFETTALTDILTKNLSTNHRAVLIKQWGNMHRRIDSFSKTTRIGQFHLDGFSGRHARNGIQRAFRAKGGRTPEILTQKVFHRGGAHKIHVSRIRKKNFHILID